MANYFRALTLGNGNINEEHITGRMAYVIDPDEDHGFGDSIVRYLVRNSSSQFRSVILESGGICELYSITVETEVKIRSDHLEANQIPDIVVEMRDSDQKLQAVMIIELKINFGAERAGQVAAQLCDAIEYYCVDTETGPLIQHFYIVTHARQESLREVELANVKTQSEKASSTLLTWNGEDRNSFVTALDTIVCTDQVTREFRNQFQNLIRFDFYKSSKIRRQHDKLLPWIEAIALDIVSNETELNDVFFTKKTGADRTSLLLNSSTNAIARVYSDGSNGLLSFNRIEGEVAEFCISESELLSKELNSEMKFTPSSNGYHVRSQIGVGRLLRSRSFENTIRKALRESIRYHISKQQRITEKHNHFYADEGRNEVEASVAFADRIASSGDIALTRYMVFEDAVGDHEHLEIYYTSARPHGQGRIKSAFTNGRVCVLINPLKQKGRQMNLEIVRFPVDQYSPEQLEWLRPEQINNSRRDSRISVCFDESISDAEFTKRNEVILKLIAGLGEVAEI